MRATLDGGAVLLLGGRAKTGPGFFYELTVLGNVGPGTTAFDEEIFGPVAALTVAAAADDAVRLANTSDFGLGGNL